MVDKSEILQLLKLKSYWWYLCYLRSSRSKCIRISSYVIISYQVLFWGVFICIVCNKGTALPHFWHLTHSSEISRAWMACDRRFSIFSICSKDGSSKGSSNVVLVLIYIYLASYNLIALHYFSIILSEYTKEIALNIIQ